MITIFRKNAGCADDKIFLKYAENAVTVNGIRYRIILNGWFFPIVIKNLEAF